MNIIKTSIEGLLVIEPKIFSDDRGHFFESWSKAAFEKEGLNLNFVQDNQSLSAKGVLRGLHFQNPPFEQGKLIRVISGAVLDFAIDIRKNSATYGQHFSVVLNGDNKTSFWIPPGFAHGFCGLGKENLVFYGCTNYRSEKHEVGILWNDPAIKIKWPIKKPILSERDKASI